MTFGVRTVTSFLFQTTNSAQSRLAYLQICASGWRRKLDRRNADGSGQSTHLLEKLLVMGPPLVATPCIHLCLGMHLSNVDAAFLSCFVEQESNGGLSCLSSPCITPALLLETEILCNSCWFSPRQDSLDFGFNLLSLPSLCPMKLVRLVELGLVYLTQSSVLAQFILYYYRPEDAMTADCSLRAFLGCP